MKVFLDCEYNGSGGELISMGLIAEDNQEFYEVLPCPNPTPWVKEHVIPQLNKTPVVKVRFTQTLYHYLNRYDTVEVIADWPEDVAYFCQSLISSPGERISTPPLSIAIIPDIGSVASCTPHNALADAEAIKKSYYELRLF